jgi:hypothetical protein
LAAKETENKILMLSATIVEKPLDFAIFAYILGFSDNLRILIEWIQKLSSPAKTIYTMLYSKDNPLAARLSIEELGDKFPETQITAETYTMKKSNEISKVYEDIAKKIETYKKNGEENKFIIAKLQTEFRNIELLKIPTFIELTKDYIENGFSVVIFVNYTDTLKLLAKELHTNVVIYGEQTSKERDENIEKFQTDNARIIIANIRAGGVGISLHDLNGKYPRVSLISPTHSATNLIQALGRIHRSGGKSKSLQRIIFAANTPEDNISKMLFRKLMNLSLLNDGDLETYFIDGLIKNNNTQISNDNSLVEKDLKIIINNQFEKIKKKNIIKTDKISNLFPHAIDTISGIDTIYLLQGDKIFADKEILLMGEYHTSFNPCKKCYNNCLEVIDIVNYILHCTNHKKRKHSNIIDFYIEKPYSPNEKNKFASGILFGRISRIEKLYDLYKHLLDEKYPNIEKLRMHAVDIRRPSNNNNNLLLEAFGILYVLSFMILGYDYNNIITNFLKPDKKLKIDYTNNVKFFEYYKETIIYVHDYLDKPDNQIYIKKILSGHDDILNIFKIIKQREKAMKDNDLNNVHINKFFNNLQKNILQWFINDDIAYKHLMDFKNIVKSIKHIDNTQDFITEFLNILSKDKTYIVNNPDITHPTIIILNTLCNYMDTYTIYRMLRKFDNKEQNIIVFYGGSLHSKNIYKTLINTGYFKLIVKQNEKLSHDQPLDCKILEKN